MPIYPGDKSSLYAQLPGCFLPRGGSESGAGLVWVSSLSSETITRIFAALLASVFIPAWATGELSPTLQLATISTQGSLNNTNNKTSGTWLGC